MTAKTNLFFAAALLAGFLTACGARNPPT